LNYKPNFAGIDGFGPPTLYLTGRRS
jgi:hypothetical protein